jgi:hypothetical protein
VIALLSAVLLTLNSTGEFIGDCKVLLQKADAAFSQ